MLTKESLAIFVLSLLFNTLGAVMLKKGASRLRVEDGSNFKTRVSGFTRHMLSSREVAIGLLLESIAIIGWLAFISRAALSVAFPLSSISNVTILLASHYLLREYISPRRWAGVLLILGGILLIANA